MILSRSALRLVPLTALAALVACSEDASPETRSALARIDPSCAPTGGTKLPGRVEAEDYVDGYDTTPGNAGGVCRDDDVDLEACADEGGGFDLAWTAPGELVDYAIDVPASGSFDVSARVASAWSDTAFHLEVDGERIASFAVPNTGDWQRWQTVTAPAVSLAAGSHTLRLVTDAYGFNVNYLDFVAAGSAPPSLPSPPSPSPSPSPSPMAGYHVVFDDEFDSMDTISADGSSGLWMANNDWMRAGTGAADIGMMSVANGVLRMTSTVDRVSNLTTARQTPLFEDTFEGRGFLFGYFESRFFWKGGKGTWPAFWLIGTPIDVGPNQHAACEIDIQEGQGAGPTGPDQMNSTVHTNEGGYHVALADQYKKVLTDGFHVYGMRWTASRIDFYLDGELQGGVDTPADLQSTPLHLVLGLQMGDWGAGGNDPDDTTPAPAEMLVDYVRVYQQ